VLAVACATPYQEKGAHANLGADGGYSEEPLSHGRFVVHASGNLLTDLDTTMTHARTRAGELCPTGYDVLDSAAGTVPIQRPGIVNARATVVTLFVQCQPAQLAPGVAAPDDRWWCATDSTETTGFCERQKDACQARGTDAEAKGLPHEPCVPRPAAACFRSATGRVVTVNCSPIMTMCQSRRDNLSYEIQRDHDHDRHVLTECALAE
jgi:hypothetical protein